MKNMLFVAIVGLFLAGSLAGCATHQKTMEEQADEARARAYPDEVEEKSVVNELLTIIDAAVSP